jgi:DNA-binding MarR family transcriptional regulator
MRTEPAHQDESNSADASTAPRGNTASRGDTAARKDALYTERAASGGSAGPWEGAAAEGSASQLAEQFLRVTRRLRRAQSERLAPLGLTPGQARALRVVAGAERPLRMVELAERLGVVPRSVTTVVDALETSGLVRRETDPANRRSFLLMLTDAGVAVREQMREARRQASEDLFAPLSSAQRVQLLDLLAATELPCERR